MTVRSSTTLSTVLIVPGDDHTGALYADAISTHCPGVRSLRVAELRSDMPSLAAARDGGAHSLAVVSCTGPGAARFSHLARVRVAYGDLPVLALIAADQPAAAELALSIGADDVLLTAPGYLEQLPVRVKANLRRIAQKNSAAQRTGGLDGLGAEVRRLERLNAELTARLDRLENLAGTDPLTGLANRRAFEGQLAQAASAAQRHDLPLALLMLDVDGLKACNDGLGHTAGDRVLKGLAEVLRAASRTSDLPARLGGDEFALLLPHTDAAQAATVATRVLAMFQTKVADVQRRLAEAPGIHVVMRRRGKASVVLPNLSIGLAARAKGAGSPIASLVEAADKALYRAKAAGKGRIEAAETAPGGVQVVTRPTPLAA